MRFQAFLACGMVGLLAGWTSAAPDQPAASPKLSKINVAQIELKGSYNEGATAAGLFGEVTENLAGLIGRLDKAANDDAVQVVVLKLNGPSLGWGKLNEVRQAIGRVKASKKKVYAWIEQGSSMDYLVASACDQVVIPESGALLLVGLRAEVSFYKNLLDWLAIKPDILRVGEFKSAGEPYSRTEMSPEFRLEMEAVLDDYYAQMIDIIAKSRKLDPAKVKALIDRGPLTAKDSLENGLVDKLAYEDELATLIKGDQKEAEVKLIAKYGKKKLDTDFSGFGGMVKMMNLMMGVEPGAKTSNAPKVAVIHATGVIMPGSSAADFLGDETLGADTFIKAVNKANEDSTVKAIVLRIDSPGGSALASDLMWRSLQKVKKPVVVSMGNVAASGGYYIAMGAQKIYAEPGTITGSIGVVGGKMGLQGLYEKIGITTTVISKGKNSGVMSGLQGFSDSEREAMTKLLHDIYGQFTEKAAKGRKMEVEKLEKLARGRIYTGAAALKIGLVDELGTLEDAVAHAAKLGGLKTDDKYERLILPKASNPFEALFGPLDPDAAAKANHAGPAIGQMLQQLSPDLAETLKQGLVIEHLAREPRLLVMPFQLRVR